MPGQQRFTIRRDDGAGGGPVVGSGLQFTDAQAVTAPDGFKVQMPAGWLYVKLDETPQWAFLRSVGDAAATLVQPPLSFIWLCDAPAPVKMPDGTPLLCSRPRVECTDGRHEAIVGDIVVRWVAPAPAPAVT